MTPTVPIPTGSNYSRLFFTFLLLVFCTLSAAAQNTTTVTNVFQNHYSYGYQFGPVDCPSGQNVPSGQYPSTYHLERGHFMHHLDPNNAANDYWVYWAHFDNSEYGIAEVAIFKSNNECGPYLLQTGLYPQFNKDGGGYGFQPGGWQSRDDNIYRDAATQTYNQDGTVASYANAYFLTASNDLGTNNDGGGYANNTMAIFKMTPDYLGIDSTTNSATNGANWVFINAQREAPVMFRKGSKYFLITSQAAGWYPSQGGYGVSSNPLTGWTAAPLAIGSSVTYGGQTSDGVEVAGTTTTSYILALDHLGGDDAKNPANAAERRDSGSMYLPIMLDDVAGTATLPWSPSFTVNNVTGVLTLPSLPNVSLSSAGSTATATVIPAASSGAITYVPANAIDDAYLTRWQGSVTGSSSFTATKPTNTAVLCPTTNATTASTCNPSLIVDLGSVQPVQEVDVAFYSVKGSEPYYIYKLNYSSDGKTWNTLDYTAFNPAANGMLNNISSVPFSNNITIGFNSLPVNFSARYVAILETGVVQSNSTTPFYGPNVYEISVIKSTAPAIPQPVTVAVVPSTTISNPASPFTVAATVAGPSGSDTPSGYIQLSAPGYVSETYGLVSGSANFTIPAGATSGGTENIVVSYRPDPTSAPIYGIGTTTGSAGVYVSKPAVPAGLTVVQSGPGVLTLSWTASVGASSYILKRSIDGGTSYSQLAAPTATSYTDSGLKNDSVTYCYTLEAVNNAGASAVSAPVCGKATANFPPSGLIVTPWASGQLYLSWANTVSGQTGYIVKRSVNGGTYSTLNTTTSSVPTYIDTELANQTNVYCYTVAAGFNGGTSSDSLAACGTATGSFVTVPGYSFETPTVGLWSTTPSFTNVGGFWTFVGNGANSGNNSGVTAVSGTFTSSNTPAISLGSQVGLLEGTGTVTQSFSGFTSGNRYTVLMSASQRQATAYQAGGANPISILVNGTSIGTVTPPQATPYYRDYGVSFTASAAMNTLQFAGTNSNGASAVLIDNVRIVSSGANAPVITVQPMTVAQGTVYATLTATVSLSGTIPTSALVFQVGSGSQVASTCVVNGSTLTCQATYPTLTLAQGANIITVTYGGDSNYSSAAATGNLAVTQPVFSSATSFTTGGTGAGSLIAVTADFNGDGRPDVAVANLANSSVSVLFGNSSGGLQAAITYPVGFAPYGLVAGDFNGDGKPDLAVVNGGASTVSILLNNGSGGFPTLNFTYNVGSGPYGISIGDFNKDGHPDLAVTNNGSKTISVLLGNANGSFQAPVSYATGNYPFGTAVGDLNNDGYADLVVWNIADNNVGVLLNDKTGKFAAQVTYATGLDPYSVSLGDFNGDGFLDMAVANLGSNTVGVLLNDKTGKFGAQTTYATGVEPTSVLAQDMNGDGVPDLVVTNLSDGTISLFPCKGDGTFLAPIVTPAGAQPYLSVAADFNGDGLTDLAVTNFTSNTVAILLQSSSAVNPLLKTKLASRQVSGVAH